MNVTLILPGTMNRSRLLTSTEELSRTLSYVELVFIGTVLAAISVVTVIGNGLVLLSFTLDKKLRTHSNYFLLSLAVSDLLIGAFSMPLFIQYLLIGEWTLGQALCDMWLAQDYMCSVASCLNLLLIGFDRYFSVTSPLRYRARRTGKRVLFMISCVWVISFLMWPPWIYAWQYIEGRRTVPDDDCYVQFLETNFYVTIITSVLDYYMPLSIMLILYYKIWRETKKREKYLAHMEAGSYSECLCPLKELDQKKGAKRFLPCYSRRHAKGNQKVPNSEDAESDLLERVAVNSTGEKTVSGSAISDEEAIALRASDLNTSSEHNTTSSCETVLSKSSSRKLTGVKNDNKAARVLTAILLAFILTTTPYNVLVIVKNLDSTHSIIPVAVWDFFYYFFYINSTLNPVCYALANRNFRRTYWKILSCSWNKKTHTEYSFSNYSDKSLQSSQNVKCTTSL
uniref:Putative muscarinic ACh receptor n=1 Tax=Cupiennius salei TaxID=6928 RepID=A0A061QLJ4_CUPSA